MTCSFCGKFQDEVDHLIVGPGVNICGECVRLCNVVIAERLLYLMRRHNDGNLDRTELITTQGWFEG